MYAFVVMLYERATLVYNSPRCKCSALIYTQTLRAGDDSDHDIDRYCIALEHEALKVLLLLP